MRFALYYAPAADAALARAAKAWLARPELRDLTVSARRYGFHATIKAPMTLRDGIDQAQLEAALADFGRRQRPARIGRLQPAPIDGFLALIPTHQADELTALAADVVTAFEALRQPLDAGETARRLMAPLTPRQIALVERYGYPYVLDEFRFHMTIADRLDDAERDRRLAEANAWFADALTEELVLDRLVLFREAAPGAAFERLADFKLEGQAG